AASTDLSVGESSGEETKTTDSVAIEPAEDVTVSAEVLRSEAADLEDNVADEAVVESQESEPKNAEVTPSEPVEEIAKQEVSGDVEVSRNEPELAVVEANQFYDKRLQSWISATREHFWQSTDGGYSIQLLTVDRESAGKLAEYLEKLPSDIDLDKVYVYETEIEGSVKLAVVYNEYKSLDRAWEAVESLPTRLQRWQPFVRTVRSLKTEITG
ncbi:MAG: hypothetical protein AAF420_13270, partial [Pseudomonadota bacterium]